MDLMVLGRVMVWDAQVVQVFEKSVIEISQVLEKRRHQKGRNIKNILYLTFHNFIGVMVISEMCSLVNIH